MENIPGGDIPRRTEPQEMEIKSIPTAIVDPHNEVLPFWFGIKNRPASLLHIDRHADMSPLEFYPRFTVASEHDILEHVKDIPTGCFIVPAINFGLISNAYWYDPSSPKEEFIKMVNSTTVLGDKSISLKNSGGGKPLYSDIEIEEATESINKSEAPLILDLDLDAFLSIRDEPSQYSNVLSNRSIRVQEILKQLTKKPVLITISRSQTPMAHVPPQKIEEVQESTIRMLEDAF